MTVATAPGSRDDDPLRERTSLMGFLFVLRKAHVCLVGKDAAHARFGRVTTHGSARAYIEELMPTLLDAREKRRRRR